MALSLSHLPARISRGARPSHPPARRRLTDADGVLAPYSHTTGGATANYTWDVGARLPVVLQDGTNTYVYGLDLISATDATGAQSYFFYDGLGSTTELSDGAGTVTSTYRYDVFGAIRSQTGTSSNSWLFTGEQRDSDSSMYYLRARYYDPTIGRFIAPDPLPTNNLYPYVGSNPVNMKDSSGLAGTGSTNSSVVGALEG